MRIRGAATASCRSRRRLGAPIALIRHDQVLTDNMRLLDGVSSALRLSVDNGRLRSEIERTLEQVRQSRQRIVEAGVEARRRIERDLHDGAQQHLVSLGMRLRLAANAARDTDELQLATELESTITMLNQALRELRELAHGIHPSLLSSGGLALAVPELAGRCPVPVVVDVQAEGRLPELIESTAYFVLAEALANVAKHSGATRAWVRAHVVDERARSSWCATTARAARRSTPAPACSASPTASTRSAARSSWRARPGRARPSPCGSRSAARSRRP